MSKSCSFHRDGGVDMKQWPLVPQSATFGGLLWLRVCAAFTLNTGASKRSFKNSFKANKYLRPTAFSPWEYKQER